jgi:site-specific DNA recombinase
VTTAIYIRVSTDEQASEGVSLAMQEQKCKQYADLNDLPEAIIYRDEGKSGGTLDRPGIDKLRSDITGGWLRDVIVLKLDRLTRKVADLGNLLEEFEKYGVTLHGVQDKLDTSSPSGRLVLHIMAAVAEWERDTIRQRVRDGMAEIKRQGFHVGSPPYGWTAVENPTGPGQLLMPTSDYPAIKQARGRHGKGDSLAMIGRHFRGQHHPQAGKRIIEAPLIEEMVAVDVNGDIIGYRYKTD